MDRAELLLFLRRHRLCVEATSSESRGPQAAVVGFGVSEDLEIVFDTLGTTRKMTNLRRDPRIALVIGWDQEQTVQLEGLADEPSGAELSRLKKVYFAAYPDGPSRENWKDMTYVRVRPIWARYSDFRPGGGIVEMTLAEPPEVVSSLQEDLGLEGAFPTAHGEKTLLVETHVSWVFLTPTEAWKVKKPVSLGFLDFRTLGARKEACEAEVLLNRRLAEDVYLGVVPVVVGDDGRHRAIGGGEVVDWAVQMKRLPDAWRADEKLRTGTLSPEMVDAIAVRLARFHAEARQDEYVESFGRPDAIKESIVENFAQTRDDAPKHLSPKEASSLEEWQTSFLREKKALFEDRMRHGRIREGHGDLRLEHVYLDDAGRLTVLDGIEFNERFRFIDVCADIAFLSMDLAWHGRVDLAERLLRGYAREADDYDLFAIVDFYESYRAHVRAKISAWIASSYETRETSSTVRAREAEAARRYFALAVAATRRAFAPPTLVAVGGIIASGKSTVAEWLASELDAPIVDADRTRKHLLGREPLEHVNDAAWAGAYDPAFTERVYYEVLRRAEVVLASGRSVVVDASFRSRRMREELRALATRLGVSWKLVECRAPAPVCRSRLAERAKGESVSDGRLDLFDDFVARFEAMEELDASCHLVIDTSLPREVTLSLLEQSLSPWPHGFTA